MLWNLILIGGFLYMATALRGQIRFVKQMELRLDVRITSLETQIGHLQDCVSRIEDALAVSKEFRERTVPDARSLPEEDVS